MARRMWDKNQIKKMGGGGGSFETVDTIISIDDGFKVTYADGSNLDLPLKAGSGISMDVTENGYNIEVKAEGSGGGTKLYKHEIVSSRSGTLTLTAYSFDGTAFTKANAGNLSKYVYKASYTNSPALIEFGNLGGDVVYISNFGSTTPTFTDISLYTPNPSDTLTDTVTEL